MKEAVAPICNLSLSRSDLLGSRRRWVGRTGRRWDTSGGCSVKRVQKSEDQQLRMEGEEGNGYINEPLE